MKKLASSAAAVEKANTGSAGLLPKEKMSFEEYNKAGRVMGFHDSVITPNVVQKNIIGDKTEETITGYIPVKELSYLSLQFKFVEIEKIVKTEFKNILSYAKFIKYGKTAKDKENILVGYFNKETIFKLNKVKEEAPVTNSIFDRSLRSLENFTEKETIIKTLGHVIQQDKGICYDEEGRVFVVFDVAKVFAELVIPSNLTMNDPKIKLEDIPKIVKESAHKYISVSDVKVDEDRVYGAIVCKGVDSNLNIKVNTNNFVAMNTSVEITSFLASVRSKIAQMLDITEDEVDCKFIDMVKLLDTNNKHDKLYKDLVALTGADTGVVQSVLVINSEEYIRKDKERTNLFGRCHAQMGGFKESELLAHPFWKYLTTNIITTYVIDNKAYFVPDIRKVALFKYFGGMGYYSPLKYNKTFAVSTTSDEKIISFAIHI